MTPCPHVVLGLATAVVQVGTAGLFFVLHGRRRHRGWLLLACACLLMAARRLTALPADRFAWAWVDRYGLPPTVTFLIALAAVWFLKNPPNGKAPDS